MSISKATTVFSFLIKSIVVLISIDFVIRAILYHAWGPMAVFLEILAPATHFFGYTKRNETLFGLEYYLPSYHAVLTFDWSPVRSWRIRWHVLTAIAWGFGTANLYLPAKFRNAFPQLHRMAGYVFFGLGIPTVVLGGLVGSQDFSGFAGQCGFIGMAINTVTWMLFALQHARMRNFVEHERFVKIAYYSGFCSSGVYRVYLGLIPYFLNDLGVYDLDKPGNSERWVQAYVAGAWGSWVIPLFIFTVANSLKTFNSSKAKSA